MKAIETAFKSGNIDSSESLIQKSSNKNVVDRFWRQLRAETLILFSLYFCNLKNFFSFT